MYIETGLHQQARGAWERGKKRTRCPPLSVIVTTIEFVDDVVSPSSNTKFTCFPAITLGGISTVARVYHSISDVPIVIVLLGMLYRHFE